VLMRSLLRKHLVPYILFCVQIDGRPTLRVFDSGAHVAVVSQSVISAFGLSVSRLSDVTFTSADDMSIDSIEICDDFKFRIYSTCVYVVRATSFQLLLGLEFIWITSVDRENRKLRWMEEVEVAGLYKHALNRYWYPVILQTFRRESSIAPIHITLFLRSFFLPIPVMILHSNPSRTTAAISHETK
jgi:hypothetical protein